MLSRSAILDALTRLSMELSHTGVIGEINIVRGTAMVLAFNARSATKDVDAVFEPSAAVRNAAAVVARELDLPPDWLNDSVKGFLSPAADFVPFPALDLSNLRIQGPTAEYMLAMKVLAARSGSASEQGDIRDITFLIRLLGLTDAEAVMAIIRRYYDPSRILPRSVYLVDEILEEINRP